MVDHGQATKFTATGFFTTPAGGEPPPGEHHTGSVEFTGAGALTAELNGVAGASGTLTGEGTTSVQLLDALSHLEATGSGALAVQQVHNLHLGGEGRLLASRLLGLSGTGTLSVDGYRNVVPEMRLAILDDSLHQAPTAVQIMVVDAYPELPITVTINEVEVATVTSDSDGYLAPTSIAVPDTLGAGTHKLTVTQAGAQSASANFTLEENPAPNEVGTGEDADPVEIPAATATPVRRWVLQDLMPGGLGSYVMPINPTAMTLPMFERRLEALHTTSVTGSRHVYEGGATPVDWMFNGYCPTQEMHDQLVAYGALNRRFYVIDHRARAWLVTFVGVELVARKRQREDAGFTDWAHDYTVRALVYSQNWQVPA